MITIKVDDKEETFLTFSDLLLGEFFAADNTVYVKCAPTEAICLKRHKKYIWHEGEIIEEKIEIEFGNPEEPDEE